MKYNRIDLLLAGKALMTRMHRMRKVVTYMEVLRRVAGVLGEEDDTLLAEALKCYLNAELRLAEENYVFMKMRGEHEEAERYKEGLYRLIEAKGVIEGIRNGTGYGCVVELDGYPGLDYRIPLNLYCTSPVGECRVEGMLAGEVVEVESYLLYDYTATVERRIKHILISDKYVGECGHTRVYIRADGALVLEHTMVGYTGVHVVKFRKPIWEYIDLNERDAAYLGVLVKKRAR